MSQLSPSSSRLQYRSINGQNMPRKQQWALIYQRNAQQYQKLKQLEKINNRDKMNTFKQQLDDQLNHKNNESNKQKQEDRKYYEYITKRAQQMRNRQEKQKREKQFKRKICEEENKNLLEFNHYKKNEQARRPIDMSFDIGYKTEQQYKQTQQLHKKQMMDILDYQLKMKNDKKRLQMMKDMETQRINRSYQEQQFAKRNSENKNFGQNQNVYQYYKQLTLDKIKRQKQIQQKLVDEAAIKKMYEQQNRKRAQSQKKQYLSNQMKETLDKQVQLHNRKKQQQTSTNPQQHSYSVIGHMFRQKISPYDKKKYSEYLKMQADEQKRKKNQWNHMSQEEYKLNLNQLNKAVNGTYAQQKYQDRSLTAIGEKQSRFNLMLNEEIRDEDANIVKERLENLKNRRKQMHSNNIF